MPQTCSKGPELFITSAQITVDTEILLAYLESQEKSGRVMFGTQADLCEPLNSFSNDVNRLCQ